MAYTPFYAGGWKNSPDTSTPISAEALQNIEDELAGLGTMATEDASSYVTGADAAKTYAPVLSTPDVYTAKVTPDVRVVTLLSGAEYETYAGQANCTVAADTANYKVGDRGLQVTVTTAGTGTLTVTPMWPLTVDTTPPRNGSVPHGPAQAVGLWVYVPDPSVLTSLTVSIYNSADGSSANRYTRGITSFTEGWNLVRMLASASSIGDWTNVYKVQLAAVTTADGASFTLGQLFLECPRKAKLLMINDGAWRTFYDNIRQPLHALGVPVTWASEIVNIGITDTAGNVMLSAGDLAVCQAEGDSVSFHGYGGTAEITSTATAAQLRQWTAKAQRYLQSNGFTGWVWRAAWLQNNAPEAAATQSQVAAMATSTGSSGLNAFPFLDRFDVPRVALHASTNDQLDSMFANLEKTHEILVMYTHGVDAAGGENATPDQVAYFLSKVQAGVEAGWLEGVTFETLMARQGAHWQQGYSAVEYIYVDETGTEQRLSG